MRMLLLAAVLALAVPTISQAIVSLGARVGYGVPAGAAFKDAPYKDRISSQVPVQVDVMFGGRELQFGLYGGYASNSVNRTTLSPGETADSATLRVGLQATSELIDLLFLGIWAGIGTGYEAMQFNLTSPTGNEVSTFRGWEFATLSAGADLKLLPLISLGLYGSAGFGQFGAYTIKTASGESSGGIGPNKAIHSMYTIGLRGAFNL